MTATHSIDAGELLGELQDDGDNDGLAVIARTEEFQNCDFLLFGHLHSFLLHLLDVLTHVFTATQTHQSCKRGMAGEKVEEAVIEYSIKANEIYRRKLCACKSWIN